MHKLTDVTDVHARRAVLGTLPANCSRLKAEHKKQYRYQAGTFSALTPHVPPR